MSNPADRGEMAGTRDALASAAALAALVAVVLMATAGSTTAAARGPAFELDDIGNFNSPVYIDNAPGAEGLLFVVERQGKIRVLKNGVKKAKPFLNIKDLVRSGGEEGLLSLAFHPDYDTNRRFYVYYVNNNGDIRIDQFKRKQTTANKASLDSRKKVITIEHDQADNHNGGQLQFGPGGFLYAGIGDGGPAGDPENDSQDSSTLLGKLLRIDPQAGGGYEVPPTNPFVDVAGDDEIFALGLRNPWRFSFDSGAEALTIADVGGSDWEEIDYLAGANPGLGANFGWNDFEGTSETSFGIAPNASPHTAPISEFSHGAPDRFCSITGGYIVRDPDLASLTGDYLFTDLCVGDLRTVDIPTGADGTDLGLHVSSPSSFGEGEDGQLYVASIEGDVFAIEPGP